LVYYKLNLTGLVTFGLIALIFVIPSFYLIRDFIYGLILKFQDKIRIGKYIAFDETKGTIFKAGYFRIELSDEQQNIISIPYSTLYAKKITNRQGNLYLKKVSIQFNLYSKIGINERIPQLLLNILNTPWVSVTQDSVIEHIVNDGDLYKISVGVYLLDEKFAQNLKAMVESNMNMNQ
jgi:hypothetical protein